VKKMMRVSRRKLIGGAALVGAGLYITKPIKRDKSGPRNPYFTDMQSALRKAGVATPTLVLDLDRLDKNIETLISDLPKGMGHRVPSKSLPSQKLLEHVLAKTQSPRLMTFHLPMLLDISKTLPEIDQLLGKPLPVDGVSAYFENLPPSQTSSADRVQWLIDTPLRLSQYGRLAKALGLRLRVNLELDVGLHRGGFLPESSDFQSVLNSIEAHPNLEFSGFMGYEPHITALPKAFGMRNTAKQAAWKAYEIANYKAVETFKPELLQRATRNAAGSPTYKLYSDTAIANEVSVGSGLVKPTKFDTDLLSEFLPACFIAAPVLKTMEQTQIPGLEALTDIQSRMNPNKKKTVFTAGGYWKAVPVDPPGLQFNGLYGRSTNQEMLNGGENLSLIPDDFVFLRPEQSEFVFLQFGDLAIYSKGEITEFWPVYSGSA